MVFSLNFEDFRFSYKLQHLVADNRRNSQFFAEKCLKLQNFAETRLSEELSGTFSAHVRKFVRFGAKLGEPDQKTGCFQRKSSK